MFDVYSMFEQHGSYKVWAQNNMVIADLKGAWNKEAALNFEQEFMKVAQEMPEKWGHLVYLNDWELCDPAMFPVIERLVTWCIRHGLTRAANVYPKSAVKEEFINKMVVDEFGEFKRAVFDNEIDAKQWLAKYGFTYT